MKRYDLYDDMELNILACLITEPKLMEKIHVEDKHFKKYQRLWRFMKIFYSKYKTFDIPLMGAVCRNKHDLLVYFELILEGNPYINRFDYYQDELIDEFNESKKERYIIDKVYDLTNMLLVKKINTQEFILRVKDIYINADTIYEDNE